QRWSVVVISSPNITLALARARCTAFDSVGRGPSRERRLLFFACSLPDPSQGTVSAVYRIVVWNWQSRDAVIGFWSLARLTPKKIPLASIGISSNNGVVRTGADFLVSHTGWNYDHVPGIHLDVAAALAAESQCRRTAINSKRFMRCAVVMSKGINAVSPRVGPV